ncbi:MAG TPA: STAS/SEC14 domain-containing protein [Planctomycetota bacterium]|nr:STAS/SEC14 domain-containing protein [Planctomycetota bacterium]
MSIHLTEQRASNILVLRLSGKLARMDYLRFAPEFERHLRDHGKVRVLLEMIDFHGWETGGLWEDLKADLHHFTHLERIALVGDQRWERAMSLFCQPYTRARVRYFDRKDINRARAWLEEE